MLYNKTCGYLGEAEDMRINADKDATRFIAQRKLDDAACWVKFSLTVSGDDAYVMLPACAYDGNRFEAVERKYPPMFLEEELGKDVPARMTQVPRLNAQGDCFMDVTSGDLAVPCAAVFDKVKHEGFLLFFLQLPSLLLIIY